MVVVVYAGATSISIKMGFITSQHHQLPTPSPSPMAAPDLSLSSSHLTSRRSDLVFVVNPKGLPFALLVMYVRYYFIWVCFLCWKISGFCVELDLRTGANGKTGKEWKKLLPYLKSRLSTDCNVSFSIAFFFGKFRFLVLSVDEKKMIDLWILVRLDCWEFFLCFCPITALSFLICVAISFLIINFEVSILWFGRYLWVLSMISRDNW